MNDNIIHTCEDVDIETINNDYDYLIKMPLYTLSQEKIEELEKELEKNKTDYNILEVKTVESIWNSELENLKERLLRGYN